MSHDDLDHIPSIVPTRDNAPQRGSSKARAGSGRNAGSSRPAGKKPSAGSGGTGLLARLFITVSLVVAAVACAWVWQLQQQLQQATVQLDDYAVRIGDLEGRLSDTDQGLSQNTAAMAVKIKELYSEVDKLWASAWRTNKAKIADLEGKSTSQGKKLASAEKSLATAQSQLKGAAGDIAKLKSVAGDLSRLMTSAKSNQAEVERVADTLNRINLDLAKLNKRVQSNEEWLGSINAFRKQVNASLTELKGSVRALQATAP
jgi:chromosome segregation ATPase